MIFPMPGLIAYASSFCELLPGDVIATGTPSGVGAARSPGLSVRDDDNLKRAIVEQLDVYAHPTSTVPMGLEGSGVVDACGRVYGLHGLMVVDASIMPFVPSAPTNLTAIMIAEHVARHCLVAGSAKRLSALRTT